MRLRRSELSTPASSERMMEKAAASSADLVFLDLEDSVSPNEKVASRAKIVKALKTLDWGKKTRAYRINALDTEYAYQDIISVVEEAGEYVDVIIVPKVKSAREVWWVDTLLTQIEKRLNLSRRIGLEVLIEEVEAIIHIEEIALASPRLEALIFGPADYSASQGMDSRVIEGHLDEYPGDPWHYARNRIAIANQVFSPSQEEVAYARKLDAAYAESLANGLGAVAIDGKMIDVAVVRSLRNVIQKAEMIGM